jgi:hypothetical protein
MKVYVVEVLAGRGGRRSGFWRASDGTGGHMSEVPVSTGDPREMSISVPGMGMPPDPAGAATLGPLEEPSPMM